MFREEYTQSEWLQMGVFLIGLPIAAVAGALLGLVGKWRKGRVVTAALVGLGCAAVASAVLFLCFLLLFAANPQMRGDSLVDYFDHIFGRQVTWLPLLCGAVISLLAAIGMRGRASEKPSGLASISMRQLLLLQVFTFVTLGCWTGLRMTVQSRLSTIERAQRNWAKETWQIQRDRANEPRGIVGRLEQPSEASGEENRRLLKAIGEPWLRELHLADMSDASKLQWERLEQAKNLEIITLQVPGDLELDQNVIDALGKVTSLRELHISTGVITARDLSPLARLPNLTRFTLGQTTIDLALFSSLRESKSLELIGVADLRFVATKRSLEAPLGLRDLHVRQQGLYPMPKLEFSPMHRDLRLVYLGGNRVSKEQLASLSVLPALKVLHLDCEIAPEDLTCLSQLKSVEDITLLRKLPRQQRAVQLEAIRKLATLPTLKELMINFECLLANDEPEWDSIKWDDATNKDMEKRAMDLSNEFQKLRQNRGLAPLKVRFTRSNAAAEPDMRASETP